ncbi:protein WVD2-like 7 isoform X2 [Salvia splendens]|uniref:protein WVD2-like 7 isoform X2 n=1 Tax=Salvia splendens TaxID=180675 RepID=UPI001C253E01|nr:protein WVD2-like 7 isoform X2 [Salvia splendens]
MGDSSCLLHGFSYASAVPNESKQGNHMHALGESISFWRFTADSLSWERWSTFPHKKYVEEAESYARPGSVAQKKAFFEAHYKMIAAQRAAAAALLEQENAALTQKAQNENVGLKDDGGDHEEGGVSLNPPPDLADLGSGSVKTLDVKGDDGVRISNGGRESGVVRGNKVSKQPSVRRSNLENCAAVSAASESSETSSQIEKPLLKNKNVDSEEVSSGMISKRRTGLPSMKTSAHHKPRRVPSTPAKAMTPQLNRESNVNRSTRKSNVDALDGRRSSPKSLRALLSLGSFRESEKEPVSKNKGPESSGLAQSSTRTTGECPTPFKTPAPASTKSSVSSYPAAATPQTENRRKKTPDPSASGRKTTGPKWHILSAVCTKSLSAYRNKLQSPTVSTPFMLRTEERAAKRKQKLEEKFNATEVQKTQQKTLKEKAGNEFRKLSCSLCFKARPLPDFYKEREPPNNQTKKPPAVQPQTAVLGRSVPNKKHGTISMPPPPPPPRIIAKSSVSKNLSRKKVINQSKFLSTSLPERMAHENASPNIQQ